MERAENVGLGGEKDLKEVELERNNERIGNPGWKKG